MTKTKPNAEFKLWLKRKGLTADKFSRMTGIGFSTVYKWLAGHKPHNLYVEEVKRHFADCPIGE